MTKKPEIDGEDFEDADEEGLFDYDEALGALLATPQAQSLFNKAGGLLDSLGGLIDKASKGELRQKAPQKVKAPPLSARAVMHFGPAEVLTEKKIKDRKKALARMAHPDAGGSDQEMARINKASELLLAGLKK